MTLSLIKANWPAPAFIHAFSTTRLDGLSHSPYDSLNLALHVGDNAEHVLKNREKLQAACKMPSPVKWLTQTHSATVLWADSIDPNALPPEGDASTTCQTGRVCAVLTADCLPLLICDPIQPQVAAVHAGWRGLAKGIVAETLRLFPDPHRCLAWLGPAICAKHYEITEATYKQLANSKTASAFTPKDEGKYQCDLYEIARLQLRALGVSAIYGGEHCSYHENDLFFSFRKAQTTGRIASCIWIDAAKK